MGVSRHGPGCLAMLAALCGCLFDAAGLGTDGGSAGGTGSGTGTSEVGGSNATPTGEPTTTTEPVTATDPGGEPTTMPAGPSDPGTSTTPDPDTTLETTVEPGDTTVGETTEGQTTTDPGETTMAPCEPYMYYQDGDVDGFGDDLVTMFTCPQPDGWVTVGGDCDDQEAAANPGAPEVCDAIDNDCDGVVNEYEEGSNEVCGGCTTIPRMNKLYYFCDTALAWEAAKNACGMVPVGPTSVVKDSDAGEHAWLVEQLEGLMAEPGAWWIGGRKAGFNLTNYVWQDNAPVPNFDERWAAGDPDIVKDGRCVALTTPASMEEPGQWIDPLCDETLPYICEGPLPPP